MNQLIPFNPTAGGKTPNLCLANVCAGFGIPNKYGSAWEAWEHTEQHTDSIPDGLDVPVFFSYSATIDGVYANYGHIGVRLASGNFWSDGNIYDSIDAYLINHWPKYVGWGESINDIQIIKEGASPQGENMDEFKQLAIDRMGMLVQVAQIVIPNFTGEVDGNNFPQVLANIHQLYKQNDEVTKIAEDRLTTIGDLQKQLDEVKSTPPPSPAPTPETPPTPVAPAPEPAGQGTLPTPEPTPTKSLLSSLLDVLYRVFLDFKGKK